jgi:myo-inositol-1(or 4)-monophosphatase
MHEAGRLIERHRAQGLVPVEKPGGAGPVTAADRAADAFLFHELRSIYPAGWLSEERADDPGRLAERFVWIVDPLDGTREFVEGVPQYSISVALVEAGEPVLGVIHGPATGESFQAEREGGAFRNGKRICVAEGGAVLASRTEVQAGEFARFADDWVVRSSGSTALKLALVAAGDAAVTWSRGPKWEWDVCAGALLVQEAGGRATDALRRPLVFNAATPRISSIVAGAPGAWERAALAIAEAGLTRQGPATRQAT